MRMMHIRLALALILGGAIPSNGGESRRIFEDDFSRNPVPEGRWQFAHDAKCPREGVYDPDQGAASRGSLRVSSNRHWYWARWQTTGTFKVQPGRLYRLSGRIRAEAVQSGVPCIGLTFLDSGGGTVGGIQTAAVYESAWTPVSSEGIAPPRAATARVFCDAGGLHGTVWYDEIEVQELASPGVWLEAFEVHGSPSGLTPGEALTAVLALRNPFPARPRELAVTWTLRDGSGRPARDPVRQEFTLAETHRVTLPAGPLDRLGFFRLEAVVAERGTVLLTKRADVPVMPPLPDGPLPHVPFGVIAANQYALVKGGLQDTDASWRRFARMMRAAGVTDLRLWNHWTGATCPKDGEPRFAPSVIDRASRIAGEEGIRVSMVLWNRSVPEWVRGAAFDWHSYRMMRELSRHYRAFGVDRFEIDNEPSHDLHYIDRLKGGYVGVKQGNPAAEALMAGMFWAHRRRYAGVFTPAGSVLNDVGILASPCTDRINWHEYYTGPPEGTRVHQLRGDLALHRSLVDRWYDGAYGESLYQTETAYRAFDGPSRPQGHVSEYEQAFLAQRLFLLTLAGNDLDMENKAFWYYHLDDSDSPMCPWSLTGFLRNNMAPKPAYVALRHLASRIEGAEPVGALEAGPQRWALVFRRGAVPTVAVWTVDAPDTMTLEVGRDNVTVVDMWGNPTTVRTQNGKLAITVSPQPQFILDADPGQVYVPALARRLSGLQAELGPVFADWPPSAALSTALAAAVARLTEAPSSASVSPASTLAELASAAETLIDDLHARIGQGTVTMDQARPRWAVLRIADLGRMGSALLAPGPEPEPVEGAIAAADRQEARAARVLGPLSGQKRSRLFLQLGRRRLARAKWQQGRGWDPAVTAQLARLAARDLAMATRLAEHEPNPRLDVWLSSSRYTLQSELLPAEFDVTVNNASEATVAGPFAVESPMGWNVTGPAAFSVPAQQRATFAFKAEPVSASPAPAVLKIRARVGEQMTTPTAWGLTAGTRLEARYHSGPRGLDIQLINRMARSVPASVLIVTGAEPEYVALPAWGPGKGGNGAAAVKTHRARRGRPALPAGGAADSLAGSRRWQPGGTACPPCSPAAAGRADRGALADRRTLRQSAGRRILYAFSGQGP